MNRYLLPSLFIASLAAGWIVGCAGSSSSVATPARPKGPLTSADVKAAVRDLVSAYSTNDAMGFLSRVDEDGFTSFTAFGENLKDFLRDNREIDLDVIFDTDVEQGDRAASTLHWNRGLVTKAGQHVLSKGSAELVFRRAPNGRLLLTAINGQSPF
jgi:ketosteroid isomerase-like protein